MKQEYFKKGMDDRSLYYINNFIDEFEEVFGKYLSREDVIKRIEENLNDFYFTDMEYIECNRKHDKVLGRYYTDKKRIEISCELDENKIKNVVFHEMIHCITSQNNNIGFKYERIMEDPTYAIGFSEGFTQLATLERAKKYGQKSNSYPILTEQVQNFMEIVGKDDFYNTVFNNPEKISELMEEKGLVNNLEDIEIFFEALNVIHQEERFICESKLVGGDLYKRIFGPKVGFRSRLTVAKKDIIDLYINSYKNKSINNIEELNKMFNKLNSYAQQLDSTDYDQVYKMVFDHLDNLRNKNVINSNNYDEVNDELKKLYSVRNIFNEFMQLPHKQKLEKLSNFDEMEWLFQSNFEMQYKTLIAESLFMGNKGNEMFDYLIDGLAKIILDNDYDIQKLHFEVIKFPAEVVDAEIYGTNVINLYEHSLKDKKYLCTISDINESLEFVKMKPKSRDNNTYCFEDEFGNIFKYSNNEKSYYISSNKKTIKSKKINEIKSNIETLYLNCIKRINYYNFAKNKGFPNIFVNHQKDLANECLKDIQNNLDENITLKELLDLQEKYDEIEEKDNDMFFDER